MHYLHDVLESKCDVITDSAFSATSKLMDCPTTVESNGNGCREDSHRDVQAIFVADLERSLWLKTRPPAEFSLGGLVCGWQWESGLRFRERRAGQNRKARSGRGRSPEAVGGADFTSPCCRVQDSSDR